MTARMTLEEKLSGAKKAKDTRRLKKFIDHEGKVYTDLTDFWLESYYGDYEPDAGLDQIMSILSNSR